MYLTKLYLTRNSHRVGRVRSATHHIQTIARIDVRIVRACLVLTESLTGDYRRDFHVNHLLGMCQVRPVTEPTARNAARLRTATGRASEISATDAIVVAFALDYPEAVVLTSDPGDLGDLVDTQPTPVVISAV